MCITVSAIPKIESSMSAPPAGRQLSASRKRRYLIKTKLLSLARPLMQLSAKRNIVEGEENL
jgi:hypothetical protein